MKESDDDARVNLLSNSNNDYARIIDCVADDVAVEDSEANFEEASIRAQDEEESSRRLRQERGQGQEQERERERERERIRASAVEISATQTFYPNVVENSNNTDNSTANCAVGVPVLEDGTIDFRAYERQQRTARNSTVNDVSVLLDEDLTANSTNLNVVELQSYSTGLFDCLLDPLNLLKNTFCLPCGVGEVARETAQGECFPTAMSVTMANVLLNNLCFPMGFFATASCVHSSNAIAEHRIGIHDRTDLATAVCCGPCVVSRMQREINSRKLLGVMPSREELILRFPNPSFDEFDSSNDFHDRGRVNFVPPSRVRMVAHRRGQAIRW
jgi:Cys-rich protein (TIGR01571 family)